MTSKSSSRPRGRIKEQLEKATLRSAAMAQLTLTRMQRYEEEEEKIAELIDQGFDIEQRYNYKYMKPFAKDLNCSVGKLEKIVDRMIQKVKQKEQQIVSANKEMLKRAIAQKEKK